MGRRFPGSDGGGGGAAGTPGEFNQYEIYWHSGTHTWTKPAGLEGSRILVHVWGAGGMGNNATSASNKGRGGGALNCSYLTRSVCRRLTTDTERCVKIPNLIFHFVSNLTLGIVT